ncbi:hypothetical protein [Clostridium sp.]|uniref:hypothetical protein n=1 Tax=Clostridium sp. TaxID=1506 RepID=UPI003D6CBC7B
MKLKSITRILEMLSFIVGLTGCIMIFMKIELPTMMFPICTTLLIITSMSEFMKTRKLIKLAYPLLIIYFLLALPIIADFIENKILSFGFVALSFVFTTIFVYSELITSSKERKLSH